MSVCCECCVLSLRRADHSSRRSYRLWRVLVCDQETSYNEEATARSWASEPWKQTTTIQIKQLHKCGHKTFREIVSGRHLHVRGLEYFKCPGATFDTVCIRLSTSYYLISSIKSLLGFSQNSFFTRERAAFITSDEIQQVTSKS
jgi:hypothetical protein